MMDVVLATKTIARFLPKFTGLAGFETRSTTGGSTKKREKAIYYYHHHQQQQQQQHYHYHQALSHHAPQFHSGYEGPDGRFLRF
jgi:hypothetical protein